MDTKEQLIDIIVKFLEDESVRELLLEDDNLQQLMINSIDFIKLIVELERAFNIEFEDYALDYMNFRSLTELSDYVDTLQLKVNDNK